MEWSWNKDNNYYERCVAMSIAEGIANYLYLNKAVKSSDKYIKFMEDCGCDNDFIASCFHPLGF